MTKLKTMTVLMSPSVVYQDHLEATDHFSSAHLISDLVPEVEVACYLVQSRGLRQQGSYSG